MSIFGTAYEIEEGKRRFLILAHLLALDEFKELATEMLAEALSAQGVPSSVDEVLKSVQWLDEGKYVKRKDYGSVVACELLVKGREVVRGVTSPKGFERPVDYVRR